MVFRACRVGKTVLAQQVVNAFAGVGFFSASAQ